MNLFLPGAQNPSENPSDVFSSALAGFAWEMAGVAQTILGKHLSIFARCITKHRVLTSAKPGSELGKPFENWAKQAYKRGESAA